MPLKRLTTKEFIDKAKKVHGNLYNYSLVDYINYGEKVKIVCKNHGEFLQVPGSHLCGNGCKKCATKKTTNNQRFTKKEFIDKSIKKHGKKYDYSKVNYINVDTKVKIICPEHGEFLQLPYCHYQMGHGCPKCRNEKMSNMFRSDIDEFIKKAKKIHGEKYDYSKSKYINSKTEMLIICKKHGEFYQEPGYHTQRGHGCGKCLGQISKPEIEFLDYCKIRKNNRQLYIKPFKVDGLDRKNKIIYEFLGDYWHGNPTKFESADFNKTCKMTFGELYKNTFSKFDRLKERGYNIRYIWESDWKQFEKGLIKKPNLIIYEK